MKFVNLKCIAALFVMDCLLFGLMVWYTGEDTETLSNTYIYEGKDMNEKQTKTATEMKKIALTFDDGPNTEYTPVLLDGLKQRNAKVTFFLLGKEVVKSPELAGRIVQEGHLIGNHSFYHDDLSKLSTEEALEQIGRTNEVIYEVTGQYPQFLRPPFGSVNPQLVYEPPMAEVLWTIDSRDWELHDVGTIISNVIPNAEENAIILMHDSSETSIQAAFQIVDALQKEGYCFVTVDEILFD